MGVPPVEIRTRCQPGAWLAIIICSLPLTMPPTSAPPVVAQHVVQQWIWSKTDWEVFAATRKRVPDLREAIWVSTLMFEDGKVVQRLALPPAASSTRQEVAIVVRLDDSLHSAWEQYDDRTLAALLGARLTVLLNHVAAAGVHAPEVQLDYDCPVRHLKRWARVVGQLSRGPLAGRSIWITSLVSHVHGTGYGDLFRGAIAGHILQVFDTGGDAMPPDAGSLVALLTAERLPFRLGVAAFERVLPGERRTAHRRWFADLPIVARSPWYAGLCVFPAGRPWAHLLETAS